MTNRPREMHSKHHRPNRPGLQTPPAVASGAASFKPPQAPARWVMALAVLATACGDDGGQGGRDSGTTDATVATGGTETQDSNVSSNSNSSPDGSSGADPGTNSAPETETGTDGSTSGPAQPIECDDTQWEYTSTDSQGRRLIDLLFVVSPGAVAEIEGNGSTLDGYFQSLTDISNEALENSEIDTSFLRYIGAHVLLEEDFERTGLEPVLARDNINSVLGWLSSYREAYGADHVAMVVSTANTDGGANARSPGYISSYSIDLLDVGALRHELGHNMSAGHCNDGQSGVLSYGFPLGGYDANGNPISDSPLIGGTAMCGNSVRMFSNPDITLTVEELEALALQGVVPDQDYAGILGAGGTLTMGHPQFANMAQIWRDVEEEHALHVPQTLYDDDPCHQYPKDDCAGFYAEEGYGEFLFELCAGESIGERTQASEIASVRLGADVHANLYTADQFGEGTRFGGLINRIAFSSPSLAALIAVRDSPDLIGSVSVYNPNDRAAHFRVESEYDVYGTASTPSILDLTPGAEILQLLPDQTYFASSAVVGREPAAPPYTIEFGYASGTVDQEHADGFVVWFGKDGDAYRQQQPPNATLGFIPDGTGVGVRFSTFPSETIAVVGGTFNPVGGVNPTSAAFTDGAFVEVRVEVEPDSVTVFINDQQILQRSIGVSAGSYGFSVGTGAFGSEYRIREPRITPG